MGGGGSSIGGTWGSRRDMGEYRGRGVFYRRDLGE